MSSTVELPQDILNCSNESNVNNEVVPIKPEYIIRAPDLAPDASTMIDDSMTQNAPDTTENDEEGAKNGSRHKKGKKRKRMERNSARKKDVSERLCTAITRSGSCSYGDTCKFRHDIVAYMAEQNYADTKCPIFELRGKCKYGVTCRFAPSHTNEDGSQIVDEKKLAADPYAPPLNVLERKTISNLRNVKFQQAQEFINAKQERPHNTPSSVPVLPSLAIADSSSSTVPTAPESSSIRTDTEVRLRASEVKSVDFHGKLVLAPLTTVGNLPFRVIAKQFGCDVTVAEMAVARQLVSGNANEFSLIKRDPCEDVFGVQLACSQWKEAVRCTDMLFNHLGISADFVDLNAGCPLPLVCNHGGGAMLVEQSGRMGGVLTAMRGGAPQIPLTVKMRTGRVEEQPLALRLMPHLHEWGVAAVTMHGRSRMQRYKRTASWSYMAECAAAVHDSVQFIANGDVFNYEQAKSLEAYGRGKFSAVMLARGALIKPWLFTEIKEQRHWDIKDTERLDIIRRYCELGLNHWGSDELGVAKTRKFLLEWLSFAYRYVPVGILERPFVRINDKPDLYRGRTELETLLASNRCADWVRLSEMFLGPVRSGFSFEPRHKSQAY